MGNITIGLSDEDELRLRRLARERFSGKKGSLAKTVGIGIRKLEQEKSVESSKNMLLRIMDKGFKLGKIAAKHRSELYDR
ncbi:MAG TPA: hypothetical protein VFF13_05035 [archaeon]|nr:hypothetical protein [archaeon]